MQLNRQEAEALFNESVRALREGRPDDARRHAEALAATDHANSSIRLLLATACHAQGDAAAEEAALDRLIAGDPRSVRGLIMKGDCRAKAGDERTAIDFYRIALRAGAGQNQPQPVLDELRRAEAAVAQFKARYAVELDQALSARGLAPADRSPRFQQSLDIMAERKQVFFQEPTGYFFPELPQVQYYDPRDFIWAPAIEAATGTIREEIAAVVAGGIKDFRPYIRSDPNQPRGDDNPLLDSSDWSALFLCENGELFEDAVARCPRTWEAVQSAPLPRIERAAPTIMFSLLRAGARIAPHTGVQNTRLTCHLPLIVPAGCGFRVGNEVRQWEEGKLLIFDDTIEHEAWNGSVEDRIVLIFDIWRPELTDRERGEVAALLSFHTAGTDRA